MSNQLRLDVKPWYAHPWPWLLMAGPFVVILAGLFTAYLAISSNDGLVDDDYYKQGLAINRIVERDRNASQLGLQADVFQSADQSSVRVMIQGSAALAMPEAIVLRAVHPTRTGEDQIVVLRREANGVYSGTLKASLSGRWLIALEDEKRAWRLFGSWSPEKEARLHLSPAVSQ